MGGYGIHLGEKIHRWVVRQIGFDQFDIAWDESLHVIHSCDNPPCYRYDHLRLGTNADNVADRVRKGRSNRRVKLNEVELDQIRMLSQDGLSQTKLATAYGVSRGTIRRVLNGTLWQPSVIATKVET